MLGVRWLSCLWLVGLAIGAVWPGEAQADPTADDGGCADRDLLVALFHRRHDTSAKITIQRCAAIRTKQLRSTWVVVAMFEQQNVRDSTFTLKYTHSLFVLDANGDVVAAVQLGKYSERDFDKLEEERVTDVQVADLDNDGVDEVILDDNQGRWGMQQKLDVFQLAGTRLKLGLSVPIGFDDSVKGELPTSCNGRWARAGRQLIVVNVQPTGPDASNACPRPGSAAYELRAGTFVKQPISAPTFPVSAPPTTAMRPWVDRAAIAATQLMKSGEGERIARSIQHLAHPSGNNPQLRTFTVTSSGRRTLVRISTAWQGGITGTSYLTDLVWELDEQGHIAAKITADNATFSVAAANARQLDDFFRGEVYALFRNVMDVAAR